MALASWQTAQSLDSHQRADHAGLVDQHYSAGGQCAAVALGVTQKAGQGEGGHAGGFGQGRGGAPGQCRPHDPVAIGFPGSTSRFEDKRLARARGADKDGDAFARSDHVDVHVIQQPEVQLVLKQAIGSCLSS